MNDKEFNDMIQAADRKYAYSDIEKKKIKYLLEYCHANNVRWTLRGMFEVYFKCDAMPGIEITISDCSDGCARYGCSNCTAAEDAELLINQEKTIFDAASADELFFKDEVQAIISKYHGKKKGCLSDCEQEQIVKEFARELECLNLIFGNE